MGLFVESISKEERVLNPATYLATLEFRLKAPHKPILRKVEDRSQHQTDQILKKFTIVLDNKYH